MDNQPHLSIFVAEHCPGYRQALSLSQAIVSRFSDIAVDLIDVGERPHDFPERLVAVPAYVLNGRVVALGNPRQADLFGQIERVLADSATTTADDTTDE